MARMDYQQAAEILISTWRLGAQEKDYIPTSHGILDRALQRCIEQDGAFTPLGKELTFVNGRTGLQCIELQSILNWAQAAQLTQEPNPSYKVTSVKISPQAAKRNLKRLGIQISDATKWGKLLLEQVDAVKDELQRKYQNSHPHSEKTIALS